MLIIYLIRVSRPEYVKNFYNSTTKGNPIKIWAKGLSRYPSEENIQMANKYMKRLLYIINHQRNADQNHHEIPLHPH